MCLLVSAQLRPKLAELADSMCARAPRDRPVARGVVEAWRRVYALPGSVDTTSPTTTASSQTASPATTASPSSTTPRPGRLPLGDLPPNGLSTPSSSQAVKMVRTDTPGPVGHF